MAELSVPAGVDPDDPNYVENPVTTERFRFHTRPDDPTTDPLAFDLWASPRMSPVAAHVHPRQDETFSVEDGRLVLNRAGTDERFEPAESTTIEAGTPHTWRPTGDHELHLTVRLEPALETEAFLRDLAALGRDGGLKANGVPSLLRVAALYDAYGYDLMHLARPSLGVQRTVFELLSPLAKFRGYQANPVASRE